MGTGMRLTQTPTIVCECCEQYPNDSSAGEVILFGATQYSYCPLCCQKVSPPFSITYKKRWLDYKRRRYVALLFTRAKAFDRQGDYSKALRTLSRIISVDPRNSDAYFGRALLLAKLGETSAAKKDFLVWVKMKSKAKR